MTSEDFRAVNKIARYRKFIGDLKNNDEPFVIRGTTFTKKILTKDSAYKYSFQHGIKMGELYFIKKVNDYFSYLWMDEILYAGGITVDPPPVMPVVDTKKITYIRRNVFRIKHISKELYEIDLTAAYWSLAYREGFLSRELYLEGLRLSKKIRLVALGALAKRILIMQYNGHEFTSITQEPFDTKANVFFRVSFLTDYYLKTAFLSLGKSALFYWVDALFLQGAENLAIIKEYFKSNGLEFKTYELDKIVFGKNTAVIYSKDYDKKHKNKNGNPRIFNFEK